MFMNEATPTVLRVSVVMVTCFELLLDDLNLLDTASAEDLNEYILSSPQSLHTAVYVCYACTSMASLSLLGTPSIINVYDRLSIFLYSL